MASTKYWQLVKLFRNYRKRQVALFVVCVIAVLLNLYFVYQIQEFVDMITAGACDNLEILRAYSGDRNCGAAHGNCAESDVAYVSVYADESDADHDVPKVAYEESNLL